MSLYEGGLRVNGYKGLGFRVRGVGFRDSGLPVWAARVPSRPSAILL